MALSRAPQLQWSLDQTADSIWSMSRGLLQAATSDNVQVLALLACESYGATLPVSTITRLKVEKLARQNRMYALDFLKAQVGCRAGDAADMLSRSDGGIHFLCLATILVSNTDMLKSAQLLNLQIKNNANRDQPMPTLLQLRDLLVALKPKLFHCGFVGDLLGWERFCDPHSKQSLGFRYQGRSPGYAEFSLLIDALRRCFRIGGSDEFVRIECWHLFVPWVITAIKWMTGTPPFVERNQDRGYSLPADSKISILGMDIEGRFWIVISHKIDSLNNIIASGGSQDWHSSNLVAGGVTPQEWFTLRLSTLGVDPEIAMPLLREALIKIPGAFCLNERMTQMAAQARTFGLETTLPCPFPATEIRLALLDWLSAPFTTDSQDRPSIPDLLMRCAEGCSKLCRCITIEYVEREVGEDEAEMAAQPLGNDEADVANKFGDPVVCLRQKLGQIIADVLTLVLFHAGKQFELLPNLHFPDFRRLVVDSWWSVTDLVTIEDRSAYSHSWPKLIAGIWWHFLAGNVDFITCRPSQLFLHAARLLGCDDEQPENVFVSSFGGQVVYPTLMEDRRPQQSWYLQLLCRRGTLLYENVVVSKVFDRGHSHSHPDPYSEYAPLANACSLQQLEEFQNDPGLIKAFSPRPVNTDERLKIYLNWNSSLTHLESHIRHPMLDHRAGWSSVWDVVHGVAQTLFVPPCKHTGAVAGHETADLENTLVVMSGIIVRDQVRMYQDQRFLIPLNHQPGSQLVQMSIIESCFIRHAGGCVVCTLKLAASLEIQMVIC